MKILMVIENYLPHIGGVEVVFRNLAEGLSKKGHFITIVTHRQRGTPKKETINGVKIIRVSCLQSRYLFSFLSIPLAIYHARKSDIIHTTTFNGAFPAWIAAKLTRKKSIITVHEVWVNKWKEYTNMGSLDAGIHNFLERLIYKLRFDKFVGVSQSTKKQLVNLGIKDAISIYNGVDYTHFSKKINGKALRRELEIEDKFVCLTYGRAGPSKGLEYAIRAASLVDVPHFKYIFILSNNTQYRARLKRIRELIKRLRLEKKIRILPQVRHSKLPKYIKAADCVVVPSLAEGFGYTAAEACAMGVPVVATNTTSLPEVVSGKFLLVPTKSSEDIATAIERVFHKKYNKSVLKKFEIEDNVKEYLRLYTTLTGKI